MSAEAMAALADWIRWEAACAAMYSPLKGTPRYRKAQRARTAAMEKFWRLV